ncbi:hypothetical protein ACJ5NV_15420 [Loktanella agnita]
MKWGHTLAMQDQPQDPTMTVYHLVNGDATMMQARRFYASAEDK